jgi:hypothetical protein
MDTPKAAPPPAPTNPTGPTTPQQQRAQLNATHAGWLLNTVGVDASLEICTNILRVVASVELTGAPPELVSQVATWSPRCKRALAALLDAPDPAANHADAAATDISVA